MSVNQSVDTGSSGITETIPDVGDKGLYAGVEIDSQEEALAPGVPAEPTTLVADIQGAIYTVGMWRVKPGHEDDFIAAWKAVGDVYALLAQPPAGKAILVRSVSEPTLFHHMDPWLTQADVEAMQQDAQVRAALDVLKSHCTESNSTVYITAAESNVTN